MNLTVKVSFSIFIFCFFQIEGKQKQFQPLSLKEIVTIAVLKTLKTKPEIKKLPLPTELKEHLSHQQALQKILVEHEERRNPVQKALWSIARNGRHDFLIPLLIAKGADIYELKSNDFDGFTTDSVLSCAVENYHPNVVKKLLECGVFVDWQNNWRNTALIDASKKGFEAMVRTLLNNGADTNKKGYEGYTALMWVTKLGKTDIMAPDIATDIARLLLEHGTDPNIQNIDGWTSLMFAAHENNIDIMQLLLEHGADQTIQNYGTEHRDLIGPPTTALTIAENRGHNKIADLLKNPTTTKKPISNALNDGEANLIQNEVLI